MSATRARSLKERNTLICQAAYEIESLGVMLQRAFAQSKSEETAWVRGAGARLRELAAVAMNATDGNCGGDLAELEEMLYGPAWVRGQKVEAPK